MGSGWKPSCIELGGRTVENKGVDSAHDGCQMQMNRARDKRSLGPEAWSLEELQGSLVVILSHCLVSTSLRVEISSFLAVRP